MSPFKRSARAKLLGIAGEKRMYDLPLDKGAGTDFLKVQIALMAMLSVLSFAGAFTLSALQQLWSAGLENKLTVEVPVQNADGTLISASEKTEVLERAQSALSDRPDIVAAEITPEEKLEAMLSPWLGQGTGMGEIPLPGLISVTVKDNADIAAIENTLKEISPALRVETHQSWLSDALRFTGALQFAAVILIAVVVLTTIVAVAGAVQSRLATFREEVELLHLIGAGDTYIVRQFERHTFLLSLRSALMGLACGLALMFVMGWIAGRLDAVILPDFSLNLFQLGLLFLLPLGISILGTATARLTVLRSLSRMP